MDIEDERRLTKLAWWLMFFSTMLVLFFGYALITAILILPVVVFEFLCRQIICL